MSNFPRTQFFIKENEKAKKFFSIFPLKRTNGELYEYKIRFPLPGTFNFLEDARFSSTDGLVKPPKKIRKFGDNFEICYHDDGRLTFKNINKEGHVSYKTKPFRKIRTTLFLRVCLGSIDLLPCKKEKIIINDNTLLDIKELVDKSFTVDFYISKKAIQFKFKPKSAFQNSSQFLYEDEENKFYLILHFYKNFVSNDLMTIQLLPESRFTIIKRKFLYYEYMIKKRYKFLQN